MAILMTLVQLTGAYLRYLPFRDELEESKLARLKKCYLICAVVCLAINFMIFRDTVDYRGYKLGLFMDWVTYVPLSMLIIGKIRWQVFVMGMQGLWSFMIHSFSGIILSIIYGHMSEELLPTEMSMFLGIFLVSIKLEEEVFSKIKPMDELFEEKRWLVAIIPLSIFIGTIMPIVDVTFLGSWQERLSRAFFPVFFLVFYKLMMIIGREMAEERELEQKNRVLSIQTESLKEQNEIILRNQHEVGQMRADLLKNYIELERLIKKGAINEAKWQIIGQGHRLDSTRLKKYSDSALLNAAISIYMRRAEEMEIKTSCKVDLEEKTTDESELAILVSNLLENALKASETQKNPLRREINLIIRNKDGQNVLEVTNFYDGLIKFGDKGLPITEEEGHGLGMSSLELFAKKYAATYDFSEENGLVSVNIYWNDKLTDLGENYKRGGGLIYSRD